MPKWWNSVGDTTSTSTPRSRSARTASPTKCPAGEQGWRGYEVVRTATRTAPIVAAYDRAHGRLRSKRFRRARPALVPAVRARAARARAQRTRLRGVDVVDGAHRRDAR